MSYIRSIAGHTIDLPVQDPNIREQIEIAYQWDSVGNKQLLITRRLNVANDYASMIVDISPLWRMQEDI